MQKGKIIFVYLALLIGLYYAPVPKNLEEVETYESKNRKMNQIPDSTGVHLSLYYPDVHRTAAQ